MNMKSILLMSTIILTAISCSKKFDLTGHYDPTQSFEVIEYQVGTFELQVNDVRHAKLLSWLELNSQNWEPTHNEWAGKVIINQENFTLLLYRDNNDAFVNITDDKNITRNYRRKYDNDGLKFLDE